jgi:hypothetical protein
MADASITAETAATITGRLLARTGAVTLDTNTITVPTGCDTTPGTVTTSPSITSAAPPAGTAGTDYSHTITASGTPTPTFAVTEGALPPGLTLDGTTGVIAGQTTTAGEYPFVITATNGTSPDSTASYSITIGAAAVIGQPTTPSGATPGTAALAASGTDLVPALLTGLASVLLGGALLLIRRPNIPRHVG